MMALIAVLLVGGMLVGFLWLTNDAARERAGMRRMPRPAGLQRCVSLGCPEVTLIGPKELRPSASGTGNRVPE